jgi:hypothetical protein
MKNLILKTLQTAKAFLFLLVFLFVGCEEPFLSQAEIAKGLKSALEVGSEFALKTLGKEDGFLMDQAVKIGLPADAAKFVKLVADTPLVGALVGNVVKEIEKEFVLAINRAAEASIKEVVPIVLDAITMMTIIDANTILFSDNHYAATDYLHLKTYNRLSETCISVIQETLNRKIVGNASAQTIWEKLITQYNVVANMHVPYINLEPIETNLSSYTTHKALDGVFLKVGDTEQDIRTNVNARINDILRKVFGQLD